jgi:ribosomal protein S28E/S33
VFSRAFDQAALTTTAVGASVAAGFGRADIAGTVTQAAVETVTGDGTGRVIIAGTPTPAALVARQALADVFIIKLVAAAGEIDFETPAPGDRDRQ